MRLTPLLLLMLLCGCDRIHRVQTYQANATKACLAHGHTPEQCKPLPYPSHSN